MNLYLLFQFLLKNVKHIAYAAQMPLKTERDQHECGLPHPGPSCPLALSISCGDLRALGMLLLGGRWLDPTRINRIELSELTRKNLLRS